ncbi:uncharacterized protein [Pyrus communis]|uniref:uncharacterized protein n=1 Tax=Pyrus communis TaxID=23211 RepID=UPI0035C1CBC5
MNRFGMGIKLDMQKAYDRVEWDFLDAVMEKMGFCSRWRSLIRGCVSSVKFDVLLNGQAGSTFAPSRGLRQGDPLSPYLFILVGEVLSRLIQDEKNCRNLSNLLTRFCVALGQKVNLMKSSVFFGANIPNAIAAHLGNTLGMAVVSNPGTYLGVPAIWGRTKKHGLAYVKGRIMEKMQGWKQSTLSQVRKEVLIKAVVQAIPAYPMSIFKFPTVVCHELDDLDTRLSTAHCVPKALWKVIWKLEVPSKLCHFLWLTVHNCLPTRAALFRRKFSPSTACPICCCHVETIKHLFLCCSWVEPIWFGGALNYKVDRSTFPAWVDWLQAVLSPAFCNSADAKWRQSYIVFTCWCIWKARCDFVFNRVPIIPSKVPVAVSSALGSFLGVNAVLGPCKLGGIGRAAQVSRWCAPASPFLKINVDASWSKVSKLGFVGVIMRDKDMRFVAAARYSLRAPSAAAVEAMAFLRGCELGAVLGVNYVIMESDSLEAINCLSCSLSMGSWESFPVLARVKQLGGGEFQNCR